jgi:hypothetical protein
LSQLDTADRQEPSEALAIRTAHLKEKLAKLASELQRLKVIEQEMLASPDQQISLTDPDSRSMATSGRGSGVVGYNVQIAVDTQHHLIVTHEVTNTGSDRSQLARMASQAKDVLEADHRRETAEHPFATLKMRMGATHFLMKRLPKVATEMAMHVLAYNLTRVMNIMGVQPLLAAMRA